MFDSLKKGFSNAIHRLRGYGSITENNISVTVNEIKRILIQSDVNYNVAKDLIEKIKNEAIGTNVITSLNPQQVFIKIVNDNLVRIMSCGEHRLKFTDRMMILLMGLQGAGKTTFAAKLAKYMMSKKKKPLLVACDVYRPAAINQLEILANSNSLDFFKLDDEKNVNTIIRKAIESSSEFKNDVLIIDTAGRQSIDFSMMDELRAINKSFSITESLLVVDGMIGQVSIDIAKKFNEVVDISGVVLTKMDGDFNGGVALSITASINKPIKFIGVGEKIDDIEEFHADRIANRILGEGDIVSFVEKAERVFSNEEKEKFLKNNKFTYDDFVTYISMIDKIGGMKGIFSFCPGSIDMSDEDINKGMVFIKKVKAVINSMTKKERIGYCNLDLSRRIRLSKGSGISVEEVNKVIKIYEKMHDLMQKMKGGNLCNVFKMFRK